MFYSNENRDFGMTVRSHPNNSLQSTSLLVVQSKWKHERVQMGG